jgi:DNA (cytosine-5)-methyltransferase 1
MDNGELKQEIILKLNRWGAGNSLRVLDLFSGCGGLSLGFQRAGFEIIAGIEHDDKAAEIHTKNILRNLSQELIDNHNKQVDISVTSPDRFMRDVLHENTPNNLIDVVIGGPPCQAFSRVGRAKLRQIANDENAYLNDERADLYRDFLGYVRYFAPLVVLMENVPDIMNFGGKNVAEEISASLKEIGYRCSYTLLNTANYGVPQSRLRFFLIGFHESTGIMPEFPEPSHFYENANHVRMRYNFTEPPQKSNQASLFDFYKSHYLIVPDIDTNLPNAVSVREAIADLPELLDHLSNGNRRSYDTRMPFRSIQPSQFAQDMRSWPGYEAPLNGTDGHVIRHLPRDFPIFRRMACGDEYPAALKIANQLFQEKLEELGAQLNCQITEDSPYAEQYRAIKKGTVPPYDPCKFTSKWWKLVPELPSRTITAHLGKDTYSHIHYDSKQARTISIREAARLQSFPDGFEFTPTMASAFKQIGNSVPPIMAYAIAMKILATLNRMK